MDIFINWATLDCSICTLCNGVISVLCSHSVLRYVRWFYFGFSASIDYVHVLAVSDVVKLFTRKLNNNNNNNNNNWTATHKRTTYNNHIRHCTHTRTIFWKVLDYKADLRARIPLRTWTFFPCVYNMLCR
jgi:hypothetical protein